MLLKICINLFILITFLIIHTNGLICHKFNHGDPYSYPYNVIDKTQIDTDYCYIESVSINYEILNIFGGFTNGCWDPQPSCRYSVILPNTYCCCQTDYCNVYEPIINQANIAY